jgi:hypothetical protein
LQEWQLEDLSNYAYGGAGGETYEEFTKQVAALLGEEYPEDPEDREDGWGIGWFYYLMGSEDSTPLTTDGFMWLYYPPGTYTGDAYIAVTYRVDRADVLDEGFNGTRPDFDSVNYNPNAGYEVYHLIQGK